MLRFGQHPKKTDLPLASNHEIKPKKRPHGRRKWINTISITISVVVVFLLIRGRKPAKFVPNIVNSEPAPPESKMWPKETGLAEEEDDAWPDTVEFYDLEEYQGTANGRENNEIVLLLVPLRNAAKVLPLMFRNMMNM
ncbi:uncharacterized protein OGAPODRAFT_86755, partial [Ogataea polymorpha]